MFSRLHMALGLALLAILMSSMTALAKGGFSFISITGPQLKEQIRSTDLALTENFFAFADFYRDKTEAPTDPGPGYEITRYYVDGKREIAFDHLHYYPETGFVYYDGIVNGSSEYDGEWYTSQPEVKAVFEAALASATATWTEGTKSGASAAQGQSRLSLPLLPLILLISAGVAVILLFAYRLRKAAIH